MKRSCRTSAACVSLALALVLTGWLRQVGAKVQGTPSRPTFVFERPLGLGKFAVYVYENRRWSELWGIERGRNGRVPVQQVEYGVVPKGYSEYVSLKQTALRVNNLFTFDFENGSIRGGGIFAIVNRSGQPTIVQFEKSRSLEDVLKEFQNMAQ